MAVDFQIPLVTNVKCAKILIEAIARNEPLEAEEIDAQTSHTTVQLPGLVSIGTYVPTLGEHGAAAFEATTKAAVASGFVFNSIIPITSDGAAIVDARTLTRATEIINGNAYSDYSLCVAATETNAQLLQQVSAQTSALYINAADFDTSFIPSLSSHFNNWPSNKPIIVDAKSTSLASLLLLASLFNAKIHVTNVTDKNDLALISMSKQKNMKITCDTAIYSLFFSQADYPGASFLPTKEDQKALWDNLESIDCLSVGTTPYKLAQHLGEEITPGIGFADSIPLLISAVSKHKLTINDIVSKLHENPISILGLSDSESLIDVNVDRKPSTLKSPVKVWTPVKGSGVATTAAATPRTRRGSKFSFDSNRRRSLIDSLKDGEEEDSPSGADLVSFMPPKELSPPNAISTYIKGHNPFLRKNILSVSQIGRRELHALFTVAQEMRLAVEREGVLDILKGRVLTNAFFEPSTRTSSSFNAAMQRLGGRVVSISEQGSSVKKGETLQDTIRTMACYSDAIVLRHPDEESAEIADKYSPIPVINGGNGSREHPTQALLDLFTIREELGTVNGITVTFMGDLKYGRPVHSLCKLLRQYQVKIYLVAPEELRLPENLRDMLRESGMLLGESTELTPEIVSKSDVLYCTRIQQERFKDPEQYLKLKGSYQINNKVLSNAKQHMCVMHPLPRVDEINEEVDFDQRAAYFRQMRYGLFVRMAILAMVIGVEF
ncbi:unnamed protein product [Pichia kudriavzevii]